jgi:hypothetical protein
MHLSAIAIRTGFLRSGMKNAASRQGHEDSSLPGLTRHFSSSSSCAGLTRASIGFEGFLPSVMDTRVKPAYDAEYVAAKILIS